MLILLPLEGANGKIQAATGLTAANYLLTVRMGEARQRLLQCPRLTINEVAEQCGFADNAHFTHAFKRIFGYTPSEYVVLKKDK